MQRIRLTALPVLMVLGMAVAICAGSFTVFDINRSLSESETQHRLVVGSNALKEAWRLKGRLREQALLAMVANPEVVSQLNTVSKAASNESAGVAEARSALQSLRGYMNRTLADVTGDEKLEDDDLVIVSTSKGIFWADKLSTDFSQAGEMVTVGFGELESALSHRYGNYAVRTPKGAKEGVRSIYQLNAVAKELPSAQDAPPERAVLAIGRRLTNDTMTSMRDALGVDITMVQDSKALVSSVSNTSSQDKIANAQRGNLGIDLESFDSLRPLPIRFPLFVDDATSHFGHFIDSDNSNVAVVLSTRMDGLMELAGIERLFLLSLLVFLGVGIVFIVLIRHSVGPEGAENMTGKAQMSHVPIAGQAIPIVGSNAAPKKAMQNLKAVPAAATPIPAAPVKNALGALDAMDNASASEAAHIAAELSPAEFNFGDSPIAESASDDAAAVHASENGGEVVATMAEESLAELAAKAAESMGGDDAAVDSSGDEPLFDAASSSESLIDEGTGDAQEVQPLETVAEDIPADGGDDLFSAAADDAEANLDAMFPDESAAPADAAMDPNAAYYGDGTGDQAAYYGDGYDAQDGAAAYDPNDPNAQYGDATYAEGYGADVSQDYAQGDGSDGYYVDETMAAEGGMNDAAYAEALAACGAAADEEQAHFDEVYQSFVALRQECGEEGTPDYEQFMEKLRNNRDQVIQKYGCTGVRFQTYVKDGKASLKATPIR